MASQVEIEIIPEKFVSSHEVVRNNRERAAALCPASPSGNNIAAIILMLMQSTHLILIAHFYLYSFVCMGVRVCALSFVQFCHLCRPMYLPPKSRYLTISTRQGSLMRVFLLPHPLPSRPILDSWQPLICPPFLTFGHFQDVI